MLRTSFLPGKMSDVPINHLGNGVPFGFYGFKVVTVTNSAFGVPVFTLPLHPKLKKSRRNE